MIDTVYSMTFERTNYFDRSHGIVTRVESTDSQDYGFHTKGTGLTILETDEMIPLARVGALDKEFTAYQKASEDYGAATDKADHLPQSQADPIYAKADADFEAAMAGATLPDVQAQYRATLAEHKRFSRAWREMAQSGSSSLVDKPAFDFSTKDVDGKAHKLSDYRGKVVVLDFWYRGCGWCMYAMPQMKQVAVDFKDQPVAVMGVNVDQKDDDARFVIKAQELNYPTLKSTLAEARKNYGVQGYPTLIVIDQQGVIRDIEEGYSLGLRANLEKEINKLLKPSVSQVQ